MDYEIMMNGNVKIGTYAPDFEANTTMGPITLNQYKGKWVVLFSHPGDFTPVWAYNLGKYQKRLILLNIFLSTTYSKMNKNCHKIDREAIEYIYLMDNFDRTNDSVVLYELEK